jgi:hypothetical protein
MSCCSEPCEKPEKKGSSKQDDRQPGEEDSGDKGKSEDDEEKPGFPGKKDKEKPDFQV